MTPGVLAEYAGLHGPIERRDAKDYPMQDEDGHLDEQVARCSDELAAVLGDLSRDHSILVVLAALSEEFGRALAGCHESGAFTAGDVRDILSRMEAQALAGDAVPPAISSS